VPDGIDIVLVEKPDIPKLYVHEGFPNAIHYKAHIRPDTLAAVAYCEGTVAGMAGASDDCKMMWQLGIDVKPAYRSRGIAAALTNRLMTEVLRRGKIPYYATATRNIGSQRTAHRAGLIPAWACVWRGRFDGELTEPTG
jgi:GNAT superfamily N-acetyltransferase